jgi:hypothetical protein
MTPKACAGRWKATMGQRSWLHMVALTLQITRVEAPAFYEAAGYQRAATSHLFRNELKK